RTGMKKRLGFSKPFLILNQNISLKDHQSLCRVLLYERPSFLAISPSFLSNSSALSSFAKYLFKSPSKPLPCLASS
ncbi:MAG: hypothetical protein IJS60_04180, partial [Abditibacteriota bacterium]|nr:hypothetical protein [Abditibacteriota bacterium]